MDSSGDDDVVLRVKRWLELYEEIPRDIDTLHRFVTDDENIGLFGADIQKLVAVAEAARVVVRAKDEGAYFVNVGILREVLESLIIV
jgi:hypothetical protein